MNPSCSPLRLALRALLVLAIGAAPVVAASSTANAAPNRAAPRAARIVHTKAGRGASNATATAPALGAKAAPAASSPSSTPSSITADARVPGFGGQTSTIADVRLFEVTSDKTGTAIDFIGPGGHYAVFAPHGDGAAPLLGRAHGSADAAAPGGTLGVLETTAATGATGATPTPRVDGALVRTAPLPMQRALGYDVAALRPLDKEEARDLAAAIERYVAANRAQTSSVPLYRWVWPDTEAEYRKVSASLASFAHTPD